jgi:hypothetical protein
MVELDLIYLFTWRREWSDKRPGDEENSVKKGDYLRSI